MLYYMLHKSKIASQTYPQTFYSLFILYFGRHIFSTLSPINDGIYHKDDGDDDSVIYCNCNFFSWKEKQVLFLGLAFRFLGLYNFANVLMDSRKNIQTNTFFLTFSSYATYIHPFSPSISIREKVKRQPSFEYNEKSW